MTQPTTWPPQSLHEATLLVTRDLPLLRGHFPHRLVLPGVAQLALACEQAHAAYGGAVPIAVRRVKYRAPVEPGADEHCATRLRCQLFPSPVAGEVEFVLSTDLLRDGVADPGETGRRVAEGILVLAPQRSRATAPAPRPPQVAPPPQPAMRELLPHRHPALFVDAALHLGEPGQPSWFRGRVPADHAMVHKGRASIFAGLEFAAQAAACLDTLRTFPTLGARMLDGWLVGVRTATLHTPDFDVGAELTASLSTSARGSFVNLATQVAADGVLVAEADLQIFVQ